jgi:uncharacterized protein (TIGR03435 family)
MNAYRILSAQPWVARLGWTLVHFLWQGLAIGALYSVVRRAGKESSPRRRYLIACAALAAMLAAPIATYFVTGSAEPVAAMRSPSALTVARSSDSGTSFALSASETAQANAAVETIWSDWVLPSVVMLWLAGSLVFWGRLAGGWMTAARLRTHLTRMAPYEWQQTLDRLRSRLWIARPVRLLVSGLVETPTVVGWLRPVVLMPLGALAGLPVEHVEALLLHELAHIRRHDYLVNMLQSIAEALLFYHPAVWWISGHIRAERELCCDDLAVEATGDAFTYAVALADLESFRPSHTQTALAANGGCLADRIARILGQRRPETSTFWAPGLSGAILLAITACAVFGQSAEHPKFEVASIKPTPDNARQAAGLRPLPGGRLIAQNLSVRNLISNAYHLKDFQIIGGPEWTRSDGFDLEAKGESRATREQSMLMLQSLLEDRFQLKYHHETRDFPVYALVVAKGGSKLPRPKEGGCVKVDPAAPPPPGPGATPCGSINIGASPKGFNMYGGDVPISELVSQLSRALGRPVLDKTAITANFDLRLNFISDDTLTGMMEEWGTVLGHRETMMAASAAGDPYAGPNILTALQEQLGLKLESTKGPVEIMVIDHVERPSGN